MLTDKSLPWLLDGQLGLSAAWSSSVLIVSGDEAVTTVERRKLGKVDASGFNP